MTTPTSLYRPFPAAMEAYTTMALTKCFQICSAGSTEKLYTIEVHTGFSGKKPLGLVPGILLHNGPDKNHPLLAAATDISRYAARPSAFSNESIILMPSLPDGANKDLVHETMQAHIKNGNVIFNFSIEVGEEKIRREEFEWRKTGKGDDGEAPAGGYQLIRLSLEPGTGSSTVQACDDGALCVVASLEWAKLMSTKSGFALRFVGDGLTGSLGERWCLMVVMTALRLWQLRVNGRTTKYSISTGEKLRPA